MVVVQGPPPATVGVDAEVVGELHKAAGTALTAADSRRRETGEPDFASSDRQELGRALIKTAIREWREKIVASGERPLSGEEERLYSRAVFARMFGAAELSELLERDEVENIEINGYDNVWVSYSDGRKVREAPVGRSDRELVRMVQTLASSAGLSARVWDPANPEVDLRLPDGARLSGIMLATQRPAVSIRRHRYIDVELDDLVHTGTMSADVAGFLAAAVRAKHNIMIAGETNAGKTTLLRALAREFDPADRVITVEKSREIGLDHDPDRFPNLVVLEEVLPNTEGAGAITLPTLVRRSLRMNTDRIIVGEVLGDEVVTMLNAMTQGNRGSLSTIHSFSSRFVFERIATYAVQAAERLPAAVSGRLVAGALDLIVFVAFDAERERGTRSVREILEVNGWDEQAGVGASAIFVDDGSGLAVRDERVAVSDRRRRELTAVGWEDQAEIIR